MNPKAPKFKVDDRVRIKDIFEDISVKIFLAKDTLKISQEKYFLFIMC